MKETKEKIKELFELYKVIRQKEHEREPFELEEKTRIEKEMKPLLEEEIQEYDKQGDPRVKYAKGALAKGNYLAAADLVLLEVAERGEAKEHFGHLVDEFWEEMAKKGKYGN